MRAPAVVAAAAVAVGAAGLFSGAGPATGHARRVAGGPGPSVRRVSDAGRAGATRAPAPILVYAQEWSLWPSRASLPAGPVSVELDNRGMDAHDLRIERVTRSGRLYGPVQGVPVTQSGDVGSALWHLAPGHYELYCSLPGHRMRGMQARIVVR
jgi:hypothetical protein